VGTYDPYLDDVSIGNDTDSEDKMKPGPPINRKVPNPGGVCWSEEETQSYKEGWDDRDNNPDSYTYNDYVKQKRWPDQGLNPGPSRHIPDALTTELSGLIRQVSLTC
jgi:hypothetical protein